MLIEEIEALCASARRQILLVSPFVKFAVVERLLKSARAGVDITAVTRWLPQEIAAGVSDLEVWPLFRDHADRHLFLRYDLHAKLYVADDQCLTGSANLTGKALGTVSPSNLELLLPTGASEPRVARFLSQLWESTIEVTDEIHDATRDLVESLPSLPDPIEAPDWRQANGESPGLVEWVPLTRRPEDLFLAYRGADDALSSTAAFTALDDLAVLRVPPGLPAETFRAFVGVAVLRTPIIAGLDRFINEHERRFGEVRDYLQTRTNRDASRTWQTIFRWLMHFLPERYVYRRPRHSELIARRLAH